MIDKSDPRIEVNYATVIKTITIVISLGAVALDVPWGINNVRASSDADYSFLIDSDWHSCQAIGSDYQEVYAFETASFYVNICQKDNVYFYSGEAKQSDKYQGVVTTNLQNSILIPAAALDNNRGFQAKNGNVSYVVVLPFSEQANLKSSNDRPAEAILTIRRNDRLVSIESSLNKYCHQSDAIAYSNIELDRQSYSQLATIPQQHDIGWGLSSGEFKDTLPKEIFNSNSHFDFYRIDGKLHRLATCH